MEASLWTRCVRALEAELPETQFNTWVRPLQVVEVSGSLNRELSVLLHAQKLREFNVSVTDVVNALRNQNTTAPVGRVKGPLAGSPLTRP